MAREDKEKVIPAEELSVPDSVSVWETGEITSLEYNRIIREWPEKVFSYFSSSENLIKWLSPRASVDFRIGGVYFLSWGLHGEVTGEFIEIIPSERIRFTWGDQLSRETLVTVDLKAYGTKTHLRLIHQLFGGATKWQWNEGHLNEWEFFLNNLLSVVEFGVDLRPEKAREDGWNWLIGRFVSSGPSSMAKTR